MGILRLQNPTAEVRLLRVREIPRKYLDDVRGPVQLQNHSECCPRSTKGIKGVLESYHLDGVICVGPLIAPEFRENK